MDVKSLWSFLGHARFYRRFIKDFSKINEPLTQLLQKDVAFDFFEKCLVVFQTLKNALLSAPPFNLRIGANLSRSCVIQVTMPLGQFWVKEGKAEFTLYTKQVKLLVRHN
jgi:hypothetical protein